MDQAVNEEQRSRVGWNDRLAIAGSVAEAKQDHQPRARQPSEVEEVVKHREEIDLFCISFIRDFCNVSIIGGFPQFLVIWTARCT